MSWKVSFICQKRYEESTRSTCDDRNILAAMTSEYINFSLTLKRHYTIRVSEIDTIIAYFHVCYRKKKSKRKKLKTIIAKLKTKIFSYV